MDEIVLTPEQEAEAEQIEDILKAKAAAEIRFIARLLASKANRELPGAAEFRIRDAAGRTVGYVSHASEHLQESALCQLRALYKSRPELWNHY